MTRPGSVEQMALWDVIDLCAGPGGWDEGIHDLGIRPLGIEIDGRACETAVLAGHNRLRADMTTLDPAEFLGATGLIASPPCQGFSLAGKGDGRRDAALLLEAIRGPFAADPAATIAALHNRMHDDRSVLALEPLRWALTLRPAWIAWEQVPTVLPIWEACAEVLERYGYTVETGICSSEEYGVPQTRERAILVARSEDMTRKLGPAKLAPATHSYFHRRNPTQLDEGVLPWVSMAEALTWGMTGRSPEREMAAGRWKQRSNYSGPGRPGQSAAERGLGTREADEPSFAVTSKAFHWVPEEGEVVRTGNFTAQTRDADGERSRAGSRPFERPVDYPAPTVTRGASHWEIVQGKQSKATVRSADQPAPTITGGHDYGSRRFQMAAAGPTARWTSGQVPRDLDQPSATITGKGTAYWTPEGMAPEEAPGAVYRNGNRANAAKRPLGTPAPTLHFAERANKVEWMPVGLADNARASGVRVSVQEAAVLQSFPADYPWQGNKGDQYRQVGDAVPPLMARAIVDAITSLDTRGSTAQ